MIDTPAAAILRKAGHRAVDVVVDAWPSRGRKVIEFWYLPAATSPVRSGNASPAQWVDITRRKLRHEVDLDATPDVAADRRDS